jgi:predicted RNA-binding Zn-ribbon protein involved in translation (DUF1610 family)
MKSFDEATIRSAREKRVSAAKLPERREPLPIWRRFAHEAEAVRELARALHRDDQRHLMDYWKALIVGWRYRNRPDLPLDFDAIAQFAASVAAPLPKKPRESVRKHEGRIRASRRLALARSVEAMLYDSSVRPTLEWDDDGASMRVASGTGVLAIVARALADEITGAEGLVQCAGCHTDIKPERRGRLSWCPKCGVAAARKRARKKYKAKKRAEAKRG